MQEYQNSSSSPLLPYELPNFNNPICKETYESLPRIYGTRKHAKHKYIHIQAKISTKHIKTEGNHIKQQSSPRYFDSGNIIKRVGRDYMLPQTGRHENSDLIGSQAMYRRIGINLLKQVRSFQLSDLQSNHKVKPILANNPTNLLTPNSSIYSILTNSRKLHNRLQTQPSRPQTHRSVGPTIKQQLSNRNRYQKIQEQPQKQQQNQISKSARPQLHLHVQNSPRQKTTIDTNNTNVSYSQRSAHTRFMSERGTMFGSLEKRGSANGNYSRINSVLENGLFLVPAQSQYRKYIQSYKPMSSTFSLLQLLKSPNFKIIKDQKSVYFGQVNKHNLKHGYGVTISEKQIFQGEYQQNLKIAGFQRNIDGTYIGCFSKGVRSGEGTFRWNNGEIFIGNWENGMKNGFGKWKSPQGYFYEGEWQHNRQHGQGTFRHSISTYKGQFKNFLKSGRGQEVFANGDKYIGEYENGKPQGRGRYQWHKGGFYQGQFKQGKREGYGVWVDQDGNKYEGEFKDDSKHGKGKQIYKNGEKYQGIFKDGTRVSGKQANAQNQQIQIGSK